jgi:hypothetical protein
LGKAYYPKGYIPKAALPPPPTAEGEEEPKRDPDEIFKEMADSQYGQPMPDCVRERLEFM